MEHAKMARRFLSVLLLPLAALGLSTIASTVPAADPNVAKAPVVDPFDQSKVPLEVEPPPDFKGKRILIVAGKTSHGPGDHEFFAGSAVLMNLLKQTPGVFPIMARDGWPKNEKLLETADALVFYMDGRAGHPVVKENRMDLIQKQLDRGAGWVNLHYAVDYLPEHGQRVLGWMGGYYDARISTNPHWDAVIRSLPKHPIANGVKPFTINDEWYFNMHWAGDVTDVKDARGVTPILQAVPPDSSRRTEDAKKYPGRLETMAWAFERPSGSRGFGFTGGHKHANWGDENFRRVVVNAILWSAKVDVPESGAKVELDSADLSKNLDTKAVKKPAPPKK